MHLESDCTCWVLFTYVHTLFKGGKIRKGLKKSGVAKYLTIGLYLVIFLIN